MPAARQRRSSPLSAAALHAALAVAACNTAPPDPVQELVPGCADRAEDPETYGYCLYQAVGSIHDVDAMETVCSAAGSWEARCRHSWVAGHRQGVDPETLLSLCGSSDDCSFEVVDLEPVDDPLEQMARCDAHSGRHIDDCVGHALQRWYRDSPDLASFDQMAAAIPAGAIERGTFWLAAAVHCLDLGSCDRAKVDRVRDRCLGHIEAYKHSGEPGRRVFICPNAQAPQPFPPPSPQGPGPRR